MVSGHVALASSPSEWTRYLVVYRYVENILHSVLFNPWNDITSRRYSAHVPLWPESLKSKAPRVAPRDIIPWTLSCMRFQWTQQGWSTFLPFCPLWFDESFCYINSWAFWCTTYWWAKTGIQLDSIVRSINRLTAIYVCADASSYFSVCTVSGRRANANLMCSAQG